MVLRHPSKPPGCGSSQATATIQWKPLVAYFLTQRAETALEINGWLESTKGREN